jgi:hypothetical protein
MFAEVRNHGGVNFGDYAYKISTRLLDHDVFPESLFNDLITIMRAPEFLAAKGSWELIRIFDENWSQVGTQQRNRLLETFEAIFNSLDDWVACLMISEIVGMRFADEEAFNFLMRLKDSSGEMPRSFIPHGFEHIVVDSGDRELAKRAFSELLRLKGDLADAVRNEVDESLLRLRQHGIDCADDIS